MLDILYRYTNFWHQIVGREDEEEEDRHQPEILWLLKKIIKINLFKKFY